MQKVQREAAIRGSARRSERKGYDFSAQRQAAWFEPPGASGREEIRGIELGEGETLWLAHKGLPPPPAPRPLPKRALFGGCGARERRSVFPVSPSPGSAGLMPEVLRKIFRQLATESGRRPFMRWQRELLPSICFGCRPQARGRNTRRGRTFYLLKSLVLRLPPGVGGGSPSCPRQRCNSDRGGGCAPAGRQPSQAMTGIVLPGRQETPARVRCFKKGETRDGNTGQRTPKRAEKLRFFRETTDRMVGNARRFKLKLPKACQH